MTKSSSLSIISYEKASQVFEEKEVDKRNALKSCQAGGSGEGEWNRVNLHEASVRGPRVDGACGPAEMLPRMQNQCFRRCSSSLLVFKYILVHVYWYRLRCIIIFLLYEIQGGGRSPSKFLNNTDLKKLRKLRTTLKIGTSRIVSIANCSSR